MKPKLTDRQNAIWGGIAMGIVVAVVATALLVTLTSAIRLSPESWSAIAAFLSFFATAVTARLLHRQIKSAERLEQLKTMPYLQFVIVTNSSTDTPWGVYLKNTGHGPAILVEWKFSLKGKEVSNTGREGIKEIAEKFDLLNWLETFVPDKGYALGATSQESIFRMRNKPDGDGDTPPPHTFIGKLFRATNPEHLSLENWQKANLRLDQMMKEMDICLNFKSIFKEPKTITLHDGPERW